MLLESSARVKPTGAGALAGGRPESAHVDSASSTEIKCARAGGEGFKRGV